MMGCGDEEQAYQERLTMAQVPHEVPPPRRRTVMSPKPQIQPPPRPYETLKHVIRFAVYGMSTKRLWFMRAKRLMHWLLSWIWKALSYWWTRRGGKVTVWEKRIRDEKCEACPSVEKQARAVDDGYVVDLFCPHCGCGKTARAELKRKNWWRRWECLKGRHPDGWGQLLPSKGEDDEANNVDGNGDDTATAERADVRAVATVGPVPETVGARSDG